MNSIELLPNINIQHKGVVSEKFLELGIITLCEACYWVKNLPYGLNSKNENSLIIFAENCGTCTTKHGVIARLAQELEIDLYKNLGFYQLNDEIVTGINDIIQPYGLNYIPEIHCFLEYNSTKIDLTAGNCNGKNKTIQDYDFVVRVNPDLTPEENESYYISYLEKYFLIEPKLAKIGVLKILQLLELCKNQVKYQCSIMNVAV
ncbi:hypothetical protein [Calothrix sp. PCC 7507]|uniref:hypothetical protein n=1 Tax=Calothrix sp. PCC 7507 TaxID=99598 RepID=UPI00029F194A|nr:hypothetical protein [Calothrix sp. PCC 7507]AFY31485.1 hypothetical protein Cal7507_1007 [Calothrix sp. PCC 7507]